jgi:hypothetical protein
MKRPALTVCESAPGSRLRCPEASADADAAPALEPNSNATDAPPLLSIHEPAEASRDRVALGDMPALHSGAAVERTAIIACAWERKRGRRIDVRCLVQRRREAGYAGRVG